MFGFIGAALFGAICYGAWASDEQRERNEREDSRKSGRDFYFDKNGRMRHTGSGRKYTMAEIDKEFFPRSLEQINRDYDKKMHDRFDKKYYEVETEFLKSELFLTKEEAERYLEENENPFSSSIFGVSEANIEIGESSGRKYNKHF